MAHEEPRFEFPADKVAKVDFFISQGWQQLAGAAWRLYMRSGRGAVVIPWSHVEAVADGLPISLDLRQMTRHGDPELQDAIDHYDPETSALCVFVSPRDFAALAAEGPLVNGAYWRVVSMDPAPPKAHAHRGN